MDAAVTIDVLPATMCSLFRAPAASVIFADRSTLTMLLAPSRSQTSEIVTPWSQPNSSRSSGWTSRHPTAHARRSDALLTRRSPERTGRPRLAERRLRTRSRCRPTAPRPWRLNGSDAQAGYNG